MQAHFGADLLRPAWEGSVVTMGVFDGIHRGHQVLILKARELAEEEGLPSIVVTFDRHPLAVLRPESAPLPIASLGQNLRWLAELGVSQALVLPFTAQTAVQEAEDFHRLVLSGLLKARRMVAGRDFAFGRGRRGSLAWLAERIPVTLAEDVLSEGGRVSSSAIRAAIQEGRVEEAERLLSRPFELEGVVVGGQRLGRTLGFPTLNLAPSTPQILPMDGVYAGEAKTPHGVFRAAISVGLRPTVGGGPRTVEAFLIDYPGQSLYGRCAALRFFARLRGEEKFDSLEALTEQMTRDAAAARGLARGF